ncbi:hypothetical protein EW145_g3937 [Phellinidium pouzarii]|uniref:Bromo domain-containing protein n=1 Tax=Phellinidium pouzarii TaxID=167371 RepID=A0A4S4LAJ3_9AGAM|nr:hypothetical protein EW145_g3937 [Phellinidium pouzarii]
MSDHHSRRREDPRNTLEPIITNASSSSSGAHLQAVSKAILAPFRRKGDSAKLLSDLAPVLMTPKMISAAASSSSNANGSLGMSNGRMDFATLGRAPMRFGLGTRRITSTDLQIAEANEELLSADVPEPEGVASDVSLLRGFNATIPSSERGKSRRRQTRNVDTPRMGLKKLGMNARGLLAEDEGEHESGSDDDVVVVKARANGRRGRRTRESLGASIALGKDELRRQQKEILLDKENVHVRRTLMLNEIAEITHKIDALDAIRARLDADLLKLKEDELELDDELEGVRERMEFEESKTSARRIDHSSRRRKGPAFLPSEHDDLPPGVAFLTLRCSSQNAPIAALDFSEPYGTLVTACTNDVNADSAPRVWDMLGVEEIGRLRGHESAVHALQVEEHVCLTGGEDGSVRVWDLRRVGDTDAEIVSLADISEEGDEEDATNGLRNGSERGSSEADGPCMRVLEGHSKAVTALYFEENCLVTGASDKTLRQWDLMTGQCVMTMDILWAIAHPPSAPASASVYIPGTSADFVGGVQFWGYGLVSGSGDGAVRMWDMRTGQAHRTLLGHTAPVTCVQFDQLHVVSGSLDKSIRIWDIRTGGVLETINFDHGVSALQFDSRKILAAAGENGVKIYNRTTMQLSSLMTNGHTMPAERLREEEIQYRYNQALSTHMLAAINMAITDAQKKAIEDVLTVLTTETAGGRGKRVLADMFFELPDRDTWSEYYEVIPEPRCLSGVKFKLERNDKNGYDSPLVTYEDLSLVFLNALYYNEDGSQIAKDAGTLKDLLETEWKKHTVLPTPPTTLPSASLQKSAPKPSQSVASSSKNQIQTPAPKAASPLKLLKAVATAPLPVSVLSQRVSVPQPQPQPSQDMEVDIDVGGNLSDNEPEPDSFAYAENMARAAESDEIVRQLERGLPRWEGYGENGWTSGLDMDRCAEITHAIKSHKDIVSNNRVASVLDAIPEDVSIKNLSFTHPLSLKIIEIKARTREYTTSKEFELDMMRLFEKGRRWYDIGGDPYGDVLLLQRLYQALTSPTPPSGPPYASQTHFSSIRAGPGVARPVHGSSATDADLVSGVTTFRISSRDRHFVDEVNFKGWTIRLADWLHLANPDDPNRPIVAQVFKCWVSKEPSKKGRPGITACWYYRPEQTFHPANRQFWEGEVFKTGHFADHPLEDIIEKIACQFTARHLRGRPRAPFWYPGWPLYVCDSRYNDRERVFVRIKNWASCVPEEVRKKPEWMRIYEFERTIVPRRVISPFAAASNVKGRKGGRLPGGIGDAVERAEGERIEGGGTGRKRARKTGGPSGTNASTPGPGPSRFAQSLVLPSHLQPNLANPSSYPQYSVQQRASSDTPAPRRVEDRTVVAAAGGASVLVNAFVEKLPAETARHFDRDPETNEVLWFSGPPNDIARTAPPRHSLDYLHFLAMKRKRQLQAANGGGDKGEDMEDIASSKRLRSQVRAPPLASDILAELWEASKRESNV